MNKQFHQLQLVRYVASNKLMHDYPKFVQYS